MTAYVFLGFLALLGLFNVIIHVPLPRAVDIGKAGLDGVVLGGKQWYRLEAEDYHVVGMLGETNVSNSTLRFLSTRYVYYCVAVRTADEKTVVMPVCVKGEKAQSLERRESIALYGTMSKLREPLQSKMDQFVKEFGGVDSICLNDDGNSVLQRWCSAGIFAVMSAAAIYLILKIGRR